MRPNPHQGLGGLQIAGRVLRLLLPVGQLRPGLVVERFVAHERLHPPDRRLQIAALGLDPGRPRSQQTGRTIAPDCGLASCQGLVPARGRRQRHGPQVVGVQAAGIQARRLIQRRQTFVELGRGIEQLGQHQPAAGLAGAAYGQFARGLQSPLRAAQLVRPSVQALPGVLVSRIALHDVVDPVQGRFALAHAPLGVRKRRWLAKSSGLRATACSSTCRDRSYSPRRSLTSHSRWTAVVQSGLI